MIQVFRQSHWKTIALILLGILLLGACASDQKATVQMMDAAEALWQRQPIPDYEITVKVDRPDDRRRTTVVVAQGQIVQGDVSYWNATDKRWDDPYALNEEQSFPFTVPGLFDMVRGEVKNSGRGDIRVKMDGEPPFPQRITLGPVLLEGRPVVETKATISVITFSSR